MSESLEVAFQLELVRQRLCCSSRIYSPQLVLDLASPKTFRGQYRPSCDPNNCRTVTSHPACAAYGYSMTWKWLNLAGHQAELKRLGFSETGDYCEGRSRVNPAIAVITRFGRKARLTMERQSISSSLLAWEVLGFLARADFASAAAMAASRIETWSCDFVVFPWERHPAAIVCMVNADR
ncbi:MAG TPA: hypothetical protein VL171_07805 [Verrucomicrobiae bacterium]|nr:hypothetical protein [Verrucomicrobiae bacterium]